MSGYYVIPDDCAYDPLQSQGSAHSVSAEKPDRDPVEELRRVVEEVTRKPVPRPTVKLGFY